MRGGKCGPNGARCPHCGVHVHRCVCADLPTFAPSLAIVVVQHHDERAKSTSTVRLLRRLVPSVRVHVWGARDEAFVPEDVIGPDETALLLHPSPEAIVLDAKSLEQMPKKPVLILVDGTWAQASHMCRRIPLLRILPACVLPIEESGVWTVRQSPKPGAVSTLEAAAFAYRMVGEEAAANTLVQALKDANAQLMAMRGVAP